MATDVCNKCGSYDIVHNEREASWVCTDCGNVLEESVINESTPTFTDDGIVGQSYQLDGAKGRRIMMQVGLAAEISRPHIDKAVRLYTLALRDHKFTQGRRVRDVCAACLYIICRQNRTPHMLIDFADVLRINVFTLGHVFLRLCRTLALSLPVIDPSLYIQRFASQLEFGSKQQEVASTATKLVQRMKRDWMQIGRRPSGICGAALLIAARIHGFRRTQKEIINVVHICDLTLRKRLKEFDKTPTSYLTAQEFETIDLEEECDPPAFTAAVKEKKRKREDSKAAKKRKRRKVTAEESDSEADVASDSEALQLLQKEMLLAEEEFQDIDPNDLSGTVPLPAKAITSPKSPSQEKEEEPEAPTVPLMVPSDNKSLSDVDDDEIDMYLRSPEEVKVLEMLWDELYKEVLEEKAGKAFLWLTERVDAKIARKAKREAQEKARANSTRKPRRKRKKPGPAATAAEAVEGAVQNRLASRIFSNLPIKDLCRNDLNKTGDEHYDEDDEDEESDEDVRTANDFRKQFGLEANSDEEDDYD